MTIIFSSQPSQVPPLFGDWNKMITVNFFHNNKPQSTQPSQVPPLYRHLNKMDHPVWVYEYKAMPSYSSFFFHFGGSQEADFQYDTLCWPK